MSVKWKVQTPASGERGRRQHVREFAEPGVRLGEPPERLAGIAQALLGIHRVLDAPGGAAPLAQRHAERVRAHDACRDVLDDDGRHAVVAGGAEDVLADDARVALHLDRVGQLAEKPSPDADGAERAAGGEDCLHVAGRLDQPAGYVGELDDFVPLADDGEILARVAVDERLAVGDRGADGRNVDVLLDGLVEAGSLDDLLVAGAGGQSNAEAVPGQLVVKRELVGLAMAGTPYQALIPDYTVLLRWYPGP